MAAVAVDSTNSHHNNSHITNIFLYKCRPQLGETVAAVAVNSTNSHITNICINAGRKLGETVAAVAVDSTN